ncbi:MAG: succinate dehydrogenase, hydrophobic membrane anchor protein [Gammaproteobacteria bacterium]
MNLRSPLGVVRGLGSSRSGSDHWWLQRVTAVALVPLTVWLVASLVCVAGMDYAQARAWLAAPLNATLAIALVIALFWHAQLGVQVVIEDYLHGDGAKIAAQMLLRFIAALAGLASVLAILKIALAG